MQAEADLLHIQRRFMSALREPIFGDSRARSELPPRDGDVSADFVRTADELITPSATLAPVERLELYHRQYWYRLLDSIAEDFPGLRRLLGDEPFWRLLEIYLETEPPRSFTLRHLGAGLAAFILRRPELAAHPVHAEELARLEYALCQAFEAGERDPVPPGEVGRARLALQPHVRLLELRTAADTFWRRANEGRATGRVPPATPRASRFIVVSREAHALRVERLPKAAFAILRAIAETRSLDLAIGRVAATRGLLRRRDAARVSEWFRTWVGRGWLYDATPELRRTPTERSAP